MAWPLPCTLSMFILLLLLHSSPTNAQISSNITVGKPLIATTNGSLLVSPSGDFAFGFSKFLNSSNLFLLAIWYAKIPDTIVWCANDGNPVPLGSSVKITAKEGLVLSDSLGSSLWNTSNKLSDGGDVSYGFMNDTGNFILRSRMNDTPVWQSFNNPTDTLLPTQIMEINMVVDSRLSETNFTAGRFQLRLISDGNLVLNTRDLTTNYAYGAYYTTGTNDQSNPGQRLIYNESGYMYILRKDGSMFNLLQPSFTISMENYYQRATLEFDGVLAWYSVPKSSISNGWNMIQSIPNNICTLTGSPEPELGSGICGFNSICSLGNHNRPICQCPQGYSLINPNDAYGSCKPDFELGVCEEDNQGEVNDEYTLLRLQNTNWPTGDYARLQPISEEDCESSCLSDCFCGAAVYNEHASTCWKKKFPLSNGMRDNSVYANALLKVKKGNDSNDPFFPSSDEKVMYKKNTLLKVLLSGSVSVNFIVLSTIVLVIFFMHNKRHSINWFDLRSRRIVPSEYSSVRSFSYKELGNATNGFTEEIGRGAFGVVYKGKIGEKSPTYIAVKKLDRISNDADKEFETEVNAIGQTHHKNLVRFMGFCKEEDHRLLVYEYMSNGTVADYLFGDIRPSWAARIQIAQGIARGLLYLHEECSTQIIHCDIKPQNVLLDEFQNPYISDFGLAKLLVINQTHTNTAIRGTKGYVAPEWFRNKPVTAKVDVYSFGVLLLEIICCRKSVCMELIDEEGAILTDWAFDCYQSNRLDSLVNDDMEALNDITRLKRMVKVALWCVQEDPSLRPTIRTVTQMLEGLVEVPDNPRGPTSFTITTQC